jgi:hypothetical protein
MMTLGPSLQVAAARADPVVVEAFLDGFPQIQQGARSAE